MSHWLCPIRGEAENSSGDGFGILYGTSRSPYLCWSKNTSNQPCSCSLCVSLGMAPFQMTDRMHRTGNTPKPPSRRLGLHRLGYVASQSHSHPDLTKILLFRQTTTHMTPITEGSLMETYLPSTNVDLSTLSKLKPPTFCSHHN